MKVKYAYGKKMDRNGRKTATYYSTSFPPRYCTVLLSPLRRYLLSAVSANHINLDLFRMIIEEKTFIFRPEVSSKDRESRKVFAGRLVVYFLAGISS